MYTYDGSSSGGVFKCIFGKSFHLYSSRRGAFKITTNDHRRAHRRRRRRCSREKKYLFFEILSVRCSGGGGSGDGTLFQKWLAVKPWQVNGLTWFRNEIKNWTPASPHGIILTSNVTCNNALLFFSLLGSHPPLRIT